MRKFILILLLLSPLISFAEDSNLAEGYEWMTKKCDNLDCVSGNIALIDGQIASLMAKRLAYVRRGAEIKNHSVLIAKEPGGYTSSTQDSMQEAKQMGTSPGAVGDVFKSIEKQSSDYERKFLKPSPQQLQQQQLQQQQQVQPVQPGQVQPSQLQVQQNLQQQQQQVQPQVQTQVVVPQQQVQPQVVVPQQQVQQVVEPTTQVETTTEVQPVQEEQQVEVQEQVQEQPAE